ncbi:hypothetical protein QQ045_018506 [Rhodiola kirilowii]
MVEALSAQYIMQQYIAASEGQKVQSLNHNAYAMGKLKMLAYDIETLNKVIKSKKSSKAAESGGFVLWQMNLNMWYVELALVGSKGLDPRNTSSMFTNSRCMREKKINGEDCFILKVSADPMTLKARSEGPAEIIRHVLFGYFSQKTGLLDPILGGFSLNPNSDKRKRCCVLGNNHQLIPLLQTRGRNYDCSPGSLSCNPF